MPECYWAGAHRRIPPPAQGKRGRMRHQAPARTLKPHCKTQHRDHIHTPAVPQSQPYLIHPIPIHTQHRDHIHTPAIPHSQSQPAGTEADSAPPMAIAKTATKQKLSKENRERAAKSKTQSIKLSLQGRNKREPTRNVVLPCSMHTGYRHLQFSYIHCCQQPLADWEKVRGLPPLSNHFFCCS